jgi:hypothetical protein
MKKQRRTQINLILTIFGDNFDTENLSTVIGLQPVEAWQKGEPIKGNPLGLQRPETAWTYELGFHQTLFLNEVTDVFFHRFDSRKELIAKILIQGKLECKIYVVIEIYEKSLPAIFLDKKFVALANALNAEIDMDLYDFR